MKKLSYTVKLKYPNLFTLKYRRIETLRIIYNKYDKLIVPNLTQNKLHPTLETFI